VRGPSAARLSKGSRTFPFNHFSVLTRASQYDVFSRMKPLVHLCTLVTLCTVSGAAEKKKPADAPFKQGVYTDLSHLEIYRFEDGRFERWRNFSPRMPREKPVVAGTYTVSGNELRLTFEKGEKQTWTFRVHEGKPTLWDVASAAMWENMGKLGTTGVLFWTKSSPQEIIRDHPNGNE
jgi:hypothetical protein